MSFDHAYRIGDLARMFGITSRTVRYYEELGLIEPENRDGGEHRRYSERNVVRLKRIQQLKDYGLTLLEISELFDLAKKDRSGDSVRRGLAAKYRERMEEAKKKKDSLERYIEDLSWHIEQLERTPDFFDCPGASCASCQWAGRCDVRSVLDKERA